MGQDQSAPYIDGNIPPQTLESRSVEAVARLIKDGRARKIVVMVCSCLHCTSMILTRTRRAQV
jgi:hypothetical protein